MYGTDKKVSMATNRKQNSTYSSNQMVQPNYCPILSALHFISGRWKIGIIWHIDQGYNRFGLLKKVLGQVTEKMLTQQLRELEEDGFLNRKVFAEVPLRVEYSLTPLSKSLIPVLNVLNNWGEENKMPKKYATKLKKLVPIEI
jgi:DNA-binding HxlR family transcriptional regulator